MNDVGETQVSKPDAAKTHPSALGCVCAVYVRSLNQAILQPWTTSWPLLTPVQLSEVTHKFKHGLLMPKKKKKEKNNMFVQTDN